MAERKPAKAAPEVEPTARVETFEAERPDGSRVRVVRNIDTGEQAVSEVDSE